MNSDNGQTACERLLDAHFQDQGRNPISCLLITSGDDGQLIVFNVPCDDLKLKLVPDGVSMTYVLRRNQTTKPDLGWGADTAEHAS